MVNRINGRYGGRTDSCRCDRNENTGADRVMPRNDGAVSDCNCKALTERLRKIDFSIIDTVLYLDSYPECKKALAYYNKLICERDALRKALAEKCRRPMTSFENVGEAWDWIDSPWPWDVSAN